MITRRRVKKEQKKENAIVNFVDFNFNGDDVRIVDQDGNPWFVAKDVCQILGIKNHRQACADLDDDEKGVITMDTPGGPQKTLIISESGVYKLIFKSRKPVAKEFQNWLSREVVPQIRKTGSYQVDGYLESNNAIEIKYLKEKAQLQQDLIETQKKLIETINANKELAPPKRKRGRPRKNVLSPMKQEEKEFVDSEKERIQNKFRKKLYGYMRAYCDQEQTHTFAHWKTAIFKI